MLHLSKLKINTGMLLLTKLQISFGFFSCFPVMPILVPESNPACCVELTADLLVLCFTCYLFVFGGKYIELQIWGKGNMLCQTINFLGDSVSNCHKLVGLT